MRTAWGRSTPLLLHFDCPAAPALTVKELRSYPQLTPDCPHMRTVKAALANTKRNSSSSPPGCRMHMATTSLPDGLSFFNCGRSKSICKGEIATILSCFDLNLHEVDDIIQIVDHLPNLLRIDVVPMGFVHLFLQHIVSTPA